MGISITHQFAITSRCLLPCFEMPDRVTDLVLSLAILARSSAAVLEVTLGSFGMFAVSQASAKSASAASFVCGSCAPAVTNSHQ